MISNIKPIGLRMQQLILRHWYRAQYSSTFHPLHKTLQNYLSITHLKNKLQTPFDLATNILSSKKSKITINNLSPIQGPTSALPLYELYEIPSDYNTYPDPVKPANRYHHTFLQINVFQEKHGWYTPATTKYKLINYTYPTTQTANMRPLFDFMKDNPPLNQKYKINIYTDCQLVLQYLNFEAYP